MKNTYARNRMVAFKTAAKKTGLTYEEVKAAYNSKEKSDNELVQKAVAIAHAILRNYGKAYKAAQNGAVEAPAEVAAEAVAE